MIVRLVIFGFGFMLGNAIYHGAMSILFNYFNMFQYTLFLIAGAIFTCIGLFTRERKNDN